MSTGSYSVSGGLAADARTLNSLKLQAGDKSPGAIKEAAKQFESLFMRELLKTMREATMKSGLLDSAQGNMANDLLDQQFAVQMSGRPGGLSELIARQLSQQVQAANGQPADKISQANPPAANSPTRPVRTTAQQSSFVQQHTETANRIAAASGIPASYMIGQAGHETGWGQREIKLKDGTPSFNLFGIKPGANWKGKVAEVTTTEYIDGAPRKIVSKFRAYDSYEEAFRDYARLITESPRYAKAKQQTGSAYAYAQSLQRAGYATDPAYADKLSRAINATLHLQRAQA